MNREKILNLPAPDGKVIYGKLIGSLDKPLIIFAHGLTSNHDSRVPFNAAWYFASKGFSTYRFSFYFHRDDARDITDCTLATQANDLDTVVNYFRELNCKTIYVIGHSFGGLAILLSKQQAFNKAILWEPSHPDVNVFKSAKYQKELDAYIDKSGIVYLFGKNMVEHFNNLIMSEHINKRITPTMVMSAENSPLAKTNRFYFDTLPVDKAFHEIKQSDHGFTTEGAQEELFETTLKWLTK